MEDDDEFGELYNDVLTPFSDPSAFQSRQDPSRSEAASPPIKNTSTAHASDILRAPSNLDDEFGELYTDVLTSNLNRSSSAQTHENISSPSRVSQDPPLLDGKSDEYAASKDAKFTIEDDIRGVQVEQEDDGPVIPGISVSQPNVGALNPNVVSQEEGNVENEDDWKSDSDDGMRILLNENDHRDVTLGPLIGQGSGYNPFHSQFKYVRPGAAPFPGGSGGVGHVRPPVNTGAVGGRGRGADFTLPSNITIFDIDIDNFKEKPWNHPGADVSDFFNYDLNKDSWNDYCTRLKQIKSKALVQVVGSQSQQKNDPNFPPKLAAAAAGIQDPSIGNLNSQRAEPTGRPIPVVIEPIERLFSGDIHPHMRDSDSVIVLQGSVDDDSSAGHGANDQQKNDTSREDLRDDTVEEDDKQQSLDHSSHDRDVKRNCPQDVDSHHRKDRHGSPDTEKNYKGYDRRERVPHGRKYRSEDSWKHRDYRKRRDHFDKDDRKRKRDEILDQRERAERRRTERDDGYRSKQSYEESSSRREREDGRASSRSRRHAEDKGRTDHSWKDDYKGYETGTGRYSEQRKRRDRVEDASDLHYGYKEKRSRQEKSTVRDTSKKSQVERSGREEMADLTGTTKAGDAECGISDDDEQHRSKRLRSKVERWTRSEERDYSADKIQSCSQKFETEKHNSPGSGSCARVRDDVTKKSLGVDSSDPASEGKESGLAKENQHLDTVEKLKKRTERFKLPMPADKDKTPIKKTESESPSSAPSEAPGSSEVKPERPVRKRRCKR